MSYEHVKEWRNRVKRSLVECLGGKCNKCGYSLCKAALDFHHVDEGEKAFNIAAMLRNPRKTSDIIAECRKCVLLCKNCHMEFHSGLWSLGEIVLAEFDETKLPWQYGDKTCCCPVCDKSFRMRTANYKYCSVKCSNIGKRKVQRPPRKELVSLIKEQGYEATGRKFGVSGNAVRKWLKIFSF